MSEWPPEVRVALCADVARGLSVREAAAKHGVPHGTAARWWQAYRIQGGERLRPPPPSGPKRSQEGTFLLSDLVEKDRRRLLRFKDRALDVLGGEEAVLSSAEHAEHASRVALTLYRVARVFPDLLKMNSQLADDAETGGQTLEQEVADLEAALGLDPEADEDG